MIPLELEEFMVGHSLSTTSQKQYNCLWSTWRSFCEGAGRELLANRGVYMRGLSDRGKAIAISSFIRDSKVVQGKRYQRVAASISAIKFKFEIMGFDTTFLTYPMIHRTLEAAKRMKEKDSFRVQASGYAKAAPVTIEMLRSMRPKEWGSEFLVEIMKYVAGVLAFHLMLRASEFTSETMSDPYGSHAIHTEHLVVVTEAGNFPAFEWIEKSEKNTEVSGLLVTIPSSKTDQRGVGSRHYLDRSLGGDLTQLVDDLIWWVRNAAPRVGSLLFRVYGVQNQDDLGKSLTRREMSEFAKRMGESVSRDGRLFSSHSFRVGGAEFMDKRGEAAETINRGGRWAPNSVSSIGYRAPSVCSTGSLSESSGKDMVKEEKLRSKKVVWAKSVNKEY